MRMPAAAAGLSRRATTAPLLPRLAVLALLVAGWALPASAEAHAEYARSVPEAGARIPRAPARVDVWFTQELFRRIGANSLEVYATDGTRVDDGVPVIDDADRTHVAVGLAPDLEAGTYRVAWRTLSAIDGDTAEGEFSFTVDRSAPEPAPAATTEAPAASRPGASAAGPSDGASFPWWTVVGGLAVAASGVLGVWALRTPAEAGDR